MIEALPALLTTRKSSAECDEGEEGVPARHELPIALRRLREMSAASQTPARVASPPATDTETLAVGVEPVPRPDSPDTPDSEERASGPPAVGQATPEPVVSGPGTPEDVAVAPSEISGVNEAFAAELSGLRATVSELHEAVQGMRTAMDDALPRVVDDGASESDHADGLLVTSEDGPAEPTADPSPAAESAPAPGPSIGLDAVLHQLVSESTALHTRAVAEVALASVTEAHERRFAAELGRLHADMDRRLALVERAIVEAAGRPMPEPGESGEAAPPDEPAEPRPVGHSDPADEDRSRSADEPGEEQLPLFRPEDLASIH